MLFCGQCGLQLAPGSAACPRCGSITQPALLPVDNPHADEPTIQSDPRLPLQPPPQTPLPPVPGYSPLPPTPGSNDPYATEQIPDTPRPANRASHPGFSGSGYSNNPIFQDYPYQSNSSPAASNYSAQRVQESRLQQPGNVYNPSSTPGLTDWAGRGAEVPPPQEPPRKRRGYGALAALLFVLLIIACLVIVFLVKPAGLFGSPHTTPTPTATIPGTTTATSGPSPVQLAQTTVQTYYADINNRDYQSAYNLWISYNQTQSQFASGFTDTIHDTITINNATLQPDGTVKVFVTLVAQNTTGTTTYNGYYIVQQQNNSWMLLSGHLA